MTATAWLFFALIAIAGIFVAAWWLRRRRRFDFRFTPGTFEPTITSLSFESDQVKDFLPESRYIEIARTRMHYVQAGQGRDVVLLHGIGASLFIWRFLFPLLQTRYRVTAIDIAGFGRSGKKRGLDYGLDAQARRLAQALDELGINEAYLVGSSMGGAIALWMAKLYPARFVRVAALAPATDSTLVSRHLPHLQIGARVFARLMTEHTMRLMLKRVMSRHARITSEVIDRYLEPFRDGGESISAFFSATRLLADPRLPQALSTVTARVLVIWGKKDVVLPYSSIRKLMPSLKNAHLVVHEDAGHHLMEDEPLWLNEALVRFFEE